MGPQPRPLGSPGKKQPGGQGLLREVRIGTLWVCCLDTGKVLSLCIVKVSVHKLSASAEGPQNSVATYRASFLPPQLSRVRQLFSTGGPGTQVVPRWPELSHMVIPAKRKAGEWPPPAWLPATEQCFIAARRGPACLVGTPHEDLEAFATCRASFRPVCSVEFLW